MKCLNQYDKKVTIQKLDPNASGDAHGVVDKTSGSNWVTYDTAWCSVQSKGGREFWKVDQTNAEVSHVWVAQYSKTLAAATPEMRLVYEGNTYEIASVIDIDLAHEEVEIQTVQAV